MMIPTTHPHSLPTHPSHYRSEDYRLRELDLEMRPTPLHWRQEKCQIVLKYGDWDLFSKVIVDLICFRLRIFICFSIKILGGILYCT